MTTPTQPLPPTSGYPQGASTPATTPPVPAPPADLYARPAAARTPAGAESAPVTNGSPLAADGPSAAPAYGSPAPAQPVQPVGAQAAAPRPYPAGSNQPTEAFVRSTSVGLVPASQASGSLPPGSQPPYHQNFTPAAGESGGTRTRRSHPVLLVGTTALVAAILASMGTAAVGGWFSAAGATSDGTSTYSQLGSSGTSSSASGSQSAAVSGNWEAVAANVRESVVAIDVTSSQSEAEGSGVVIDAKGYVVTNNHVVSGGGTIQVILSDGTIHKAEIVGTDSTTDLAVLKLTDPPSDLKAATLGDSDKVAVGQAVMAVGNPLGLDNTVTTGIVSALDRPVTTSESSSTSSSDAVVTNAIQVDAAINPGNSGGPLFNTAGEVIGINSSIATMSSGYGSSGSSSGSIGLGFAIPSNLVENIAGQLIENGKAEHAYLGVSLSDTTATVDGVTRSGAKVEQVTSGTPAATAGLKTGDVVVGIDGKSVGGSESLTAFVRAHAVGDTSTLTVVRDGKALDVKVTFAAKPDTSSDTSTQQDQQQGGQDQQQGQDGNGWGNMPSDPFSGTDPFSQGG